MRISVNDTPRNVARIPRKLNLHMRVISGTALISRDGQTLLTGGGLPIAVADGIQSLEWDAGDLWISGSGGTAEIEVILP